MIAFYYPGKRFLTVSVTGTQCELMCEHCKGTFLKHMTPATEPEQLLETARELENEGGIGMLVSGGSDMTGRVPLERFYDALGQIKDETNLILNVHTGIVGPGEIERLARTDVDIVSLDIVGSASAVKNIYGLDVPLSRYEKMLADLTDHGLNVVPHVCIGLDSGGNSGEVEAFKMVAEHKPRMLVLTALMRPPGTIAGRTEQEHWNFVLGTATELLHDDTKLGIGCMRPRDIRILPEHLERIDALAMPSRSLKKAVAEAGIRHIEKDGCCALESLTGY